MLLKIITNNGTTKIIEGVQDAEIYHQHVLHHGSDSLLEAVYKLPVTQNSVPMGLEYFDSLPQACVLQGSLSGNHEVSPYSAQIIEYKKDGVWRKLAIHDHGYLCNDDGKTVAKLGI